MIAQARLRNRLLAQLSTADFSLLADHLQPVANSAGAILVEADTTMPFVFFMESGMVSIVARTAKGQQAEAGVIGREGFIHPAASLGADRIPHIAQVQMPGDALRISRERLMSAFDASASLRRTLLLFAEAYSVQNGFTILSNAVHQTEQRLARWLLMCHDRCDGDDLSLTHDFMGTMLSVRRPSITNALHVLEGHRLIRSERGSVNIRDRAALEHYARDTYGRSEAEYRRLLGPL